MYYTGHGHIICKNAKYSLWNYCNFSELLSELASSSSFHYIVAASSLTIVFRAALNTHFLSKYQNSAVEASCIMRFIDALLVSYWLTYLLTYMQTGSSFCLRFSFFCVSFCVFILVIASLLSHFAVNCGVLVTVAITKKHPES